MVRKARNANVVVTSRRGRVARGGEDAGRAACGAARCALRGLRLETVAKEEIVAGPANPGQSGPALSTLAEARPLDEGQALCGSVSADDLRRQREEQLVDQVGV